MTIERKAREAYDRENPWWPMSEAKPYGTVGELLFNDMAGNFNADAYRYLLDHDVIGIGSTHRAASRRSS
ncbi:hypothetical protein [Mesorhizobium sp. A556]